MSDEDDKMADAMEGLFAYDMGSTDSGIHDEVLREKVKVWLQAVDGAWLSRRVREMFLDDEMIAGGYGLADVSELLKWLSNEMDCDI